jgi:excinuclease ABC subunit A
MSKTTKKTAASNNNMQQSSAAGSGMENCSIPAYDSNECRERSLTIKYLTGEENIEIPSKRRKLNNFIEITDACEHNLQSISVKFPLFGITAVTGVSGSGKSTLVKSILYPAVNRKLNMCGDKPGIHGELRGDLRLLTAVEMIDQNAIGKNSRSNPATYVKAYDDIRRLFAEQPYAKQCGYTTSYFSFNMDGGRCPECQGDGTIKVSMQFLSDVNLVCETCGGRRFKPDLLEVKYKGYDINDILDMTVAQAIDFFDAQKEDNSALKVSQRLMPLLNVGLGYIKLGQGGHTLSGGESQRVKLASFLPVKGSKADKGSESILFIFDEPTTGLHFHDIKILLSALNSLVERGHSVLIVEHNMDVVKCADWVIDLGPEGGSKGGELCFEGTPENLAKQKSHTGTALAAAMKTKNKR